MRRSLDFLYDAAGYLAAFFVFAIFALMITGTVMRQFALKTGGQLELIEWFCAAAAFLAMAHTFRRGDFVRVTLLLDGFGPRLKRAAEVWSLAIAAAFVGYLAFWTSRSVYDNWQFHEMAGGQIAIPIWFPQMSFVVGAVLLFVAVVDELVRVLRGKQPSYVIAAEERRARGDYTEEL